MSQTSTIVSSKTSVLTTGNVPVIFGPTNSTSASTSSVPKNTSSGIIKPFIQEPTANQKEILSMIESSSSSKNKPVNDSAPQNVSNNNENVNNNKRSVVDLSSSESDDSSSSKKAKTNANVSSSSSSATEKTEKANNDHFEEKFKVLVNNAESFMKDSDFSVETSKYLIKSLDFMWNFNGLDNNMFTFANYCWTRLKAEEAKKTDFDKAKTFITEFHNKYNDQKVKRIIDVFMLPSKLQQISELSSTERLTTISKISDVSPDEVITYYKDCITYAEYSKVELSTIKPELISLLLRYISSKV